MHLLLIGGTRFVGRHAVVAARDAGHEVTLFHRGRSGAGLFPECEHVLGDRDQGLQPLAGRRFDAVIDTCGYLPAQLRASCRALLDAADHYVFVSSMSVYAAPDPRAGESSPRATLGDRPDDVVAPETYGALKALCEDAVTDAWGPRACLVRPGLVVGPHDPTARYTSWLRRCAEGGRMVVPAPPERPVSYIDARDLGEWLVACATRRLTGAFDVVGPSPDHTRAGLIAACLAATGRRAEPVWVDEPLLLAERVAPWSDLPLWIPAGEDGLLAMSAQRARRAGLRCRSADQTAAETWAWARDAGDDAGPRHPPGLPPGREAELLASWDARPR